MDIYKTLYNLSPEESTELYNFLIKTLGYRGAKVPKSYVFHVVYKSNLKEISARYINGIYKYSEADGGPNYSTTNKFLFRRMYAYTPIFESNKYNDTTDISHQTEKGSVYTSITKLENINSFFRKLKIEKIQ